MTFDELKEKALSLPLSPGVYIMKDAQDRIIYIGKAKKLKNRVSQYFQDTANHSPKTRQMVGKIHHFDFLVAASEFEALILECTLIKRHQPKYNILLKDDKGFPYVRLDLKSDFPTLTMANAPVNDGAEYFGPFGSRGTTKHLLETIRDVLKLPHCNKSINRDRQDVRVCLHYHMKQCEGWCRHKEFMPLYRSRMEQAKLLLSGQYKTVAADIRNKMLASAEEMNFELAANLRDQLNAVESLGKKQIVSTVSFSDTDVIGYARNEAKACFAVLHFRDGTLLDKDYDIFSLPDDDSAAVSSLMKQYYLNRGSTPKVVLLPFAVDDSDLFSEMLEQKFGRKCRFKVPQRGNNTRLVELAVKNAQEELSRITNIDERINGTQKLLMQMLNLQSVSRIESYDISNISGTDIVGSMVVFVDGKPKKSAYKKFKIRDLKEQDDYASMKQMLCRRFEHILSGDFEFGDVPELLLIDGGVNHAKIIAELLRGMNMYVPVFGMVKDDRHRTRALVTPEGDEIRIDNTPAIFSFIGAIQEETHRFAVDFHRKLRSKRLHYSALDAIPGIGPKRKQELLKQFKSLNAIKNASLQELQHVLPADVSKALYDHFRTEEENGQ